MNEMLSPGVIRIDGGTQPRAALKEGLVEEYRAEMAAGAEFPPVIVFYDGTEYWLADGFHRWHATMRLGAGNVAADIREGTHRDAILYSLSANATHGMRRSAEDKRHAVERILRDREWRKLADREIARHCAVSPQTVGTYRKRLESEAEAVKTASVQSGQIEKAEPEKTERQVRRGGSAYTMRTERIGKVAGNGLEPLDPADELPTEKDESPTKEDVERLHVWFDEGLLLYRKFRYGWLTPKTCADHGMPLSEDSIRGLLFFLGNMTDQRENLPSAVLRLLTDEGNSLAHVADIAWCLELADMPTGAIHNAVEKATAEDRVVTNDDFRAEARRMGSDREARP
jgi:hypothetical protein